MTTPRNTATTHCSVTDQLYNQVDVAQAQRRTRLHCALEAAALALHTAEGLLTHHACRNDLVTAAGRLERIQSLLGELREIMLLDERGL